MTALYAEIKEELIVKDNFLYLDGQPYTGVLRKDEGDGHSESNYLNGHVHGLYKSYYSSGKIKDVCLYQNGVLTGRAIKYWPNGIKKMNVNYLNGEMDGIYEEWDQNGILISMKTYYNGKLASIKGRLMTSS
jgi:antitoxin component YwqK of YwqJK toxin-antitoxin module